MNEKYKYLLLITSLNILLSSGILAYYTNNLSRAYQITINENLGVGDNYDIKGLFTFIKVNDDGTETIVYQGYNSLTKNANGIKKHVYRLFNSSHTDQVLNRIAIGDGVDDADNTNNIALVNELQRQTATFYEPADSYDGGLNYTFSFASSYTIREAGVIDLASGGYLTFYIGTLSQAVTSDDTYKVCWKFDYDQT